jgi:NAD(P)-dependent dehydrogenase (short-subunit alcohol dehydrogenase family)
LDRVVLVTGGAGGIGRATGERCRTAGDVVVLEAGGCRDQAPPSPSSNGGAQGPLEHILHLSAQAQSCASGDLARVPPCQASTPPPR